MTRRSSLKTPKGIFKEFQILKDGELLEAVCGLKTVPNSILNQIRKIKKALYGTLQNLKLITRYSAISLEKVF